MWHSPPVTIPIVSNKPSQISNNNNQSIVLENLFVMIGPFDRTRRIATHASHSCNLSIGLALWCTDHVVQSHLLKGGSKLRTSFIFIYMKFQQYRKVSTYDIRLVFLFLCGDECDELFQFSPVSMIRTIASTFLFFTAALNIGIMAAACFPTVRPPKTENIE